MPATKRRVETLEGYPVNPSLPSLDSDAGNRVNAWKAKPEKWPSQRRNSFLNPILINCTSPFDQKVFIPSKFVSSHCKMGDIALLELREPVEERGSSIGRNGNWPIDRTLIASGYGYNPKQNESMPDIMTSVKVEVAKECPEEDRVEDVICAKELYENVCEVSGERRGG